MKNYFLPLFGLIAVCGTTMAQIRVNQERINTTIDINTSRTPPSTTTASRILKLISTSGNALTLTTPTGRRLNVEVSQTSPGLIIGGNSYKTSVKGMSAIPTNDNKWNCQNKTVSLTAESSTFMTGMKNAGRFLPGTIFKYADFFTGSFNEISTGRNPITIYTTNIHSTGSTLRTINDPRQSTINEGVRNIIAPFSNNAGGAQLLYRTFTSESDIEFQIKASAGGAYGGFQASTSYEFKTNQKKVYITFDIFKSMFKIVAERPSNGFFADPTFVQSNPDLLFIKDVEYGTRILFNIEVLVSSREDIAKISASYGLGDTVKKTFSAAFDVISKLRTAQTTVNAYLTGAPMDVTTLNVNNLDEEIRELLRRCNYSTAQPIQYTIADMNDRFLAIKTITDDFVVPECNYAESVFMLKNVLVSITSGNDDKEEPSKFAMYLVRNPPYLASDPKYIIYYTKPEETIGRIGPNESRNFRMELYPYSNPKLYDELLDLKYFLRGVHYTSITHPTFL